jgi:hypothetical protein
MISASSQERGLDFLHPEVALLNIRNFAASLRRGFKAVLIY